MDDKHKLIFSVTAAAMAINTTRLILMDIQKANIISSAENDNTRQLVPIGLAAMTFITGDERYLILNALQSVPTLANIFMNLLPPLLK